MADDVRPKPGRKSKNRTTEPAGTALECASGRDGAGAMVAYSRVSGASMVARRHDFV
jgi:hypothetical protein